VAGAINAVRGSHIADEFGRGELLSLAKMSSG
jgi:hypothetical protein